MNNDHASCSLKNDWKRANFKSESRTLELFDILKGHTEVISTHIIKQRSMARRKGL